MAAPLHRTALIWIAAAILALGAYVAYSGEKSLGSRVPDWVPVYPGTSAESIKSVQAGNEHYFNFELKTHDACKKVVDWYEGKLHAAGYKTFGRFDYEGSSTVRSDGPDGARSINVHAGATADDVVIAIESIERNTSGGTTAAVPNWVPMYPGVTPGQTEASKSEQGEYHLSFSFTTRDDPAKVYSWYGSKLKALKFRVSVETTPDSVGKLDSNASDNHRTFNMRNYPTVPENTFMVELTER